MGVHNFSQSAGSCAHRVGQTPDDKFFENVVYLKALILEENFLDMYERNRATRDEKAFKKLRWRFEKSGYVNPEEEEIIDKAHEAKQKAAEKIPAETPKKGLEVYPLAIKYGLEEYYMLFYDLMHDESHSLPSAVEVHHDAKAGFVDLPYLQLIGTSSVSAIGLYVTGLVDLMYIFGLTQHSGKIVEIFNQMEALRKEGDD